MIFKIMFLTGLVGLVILFIVTMTLIVKGKKSENTVATNDVTEGKSKEINEVAEIQEEQDIVLQHVEEIVEVQEIIVENTDISQDVDMQSLIDCEDNCTEIIDEDDEMVQDAGEVAVVDSNDTCDGFSTEFNKEIDVFIKHINEEI